MIGTQTGLFGEISVPATERRESRLAERRRKAKAAYDATSKIWKSATYCFAVTEFLVTHETFIFEELSDAYNNAVKTRGFPETVNGKAFAGLQRILVAEGKIEVVKGATGVRSNGQIGPIYQSKLYRPEGELLF